MGNHFFASLWRHLRSWLHRLLPIPPGETRTFELNQDLYRALEALAEREQRPPQDLAQDLLAAAMARRQPFGDPLVIWQSLSEREQQVTALVCLRYSNRAIAARLNISAETVKTHIRNALYKFGLRHKIDLIAALAEWDFSDWDELA